jgi:hypothetical protein
MTATVIELADGKLKELDAQRDRERRHRAVDRIVRRVNALPILDDRTADEILGYNKDGIRLIIAGSALPQRGGYSARSGTSSLASRSHERHWSAALPATTSNVDQPFDLSSAFKGDDFALTDLKRAL